MKIQIVILLLICSTMFEHVQAQSRKATVVGSVVEYLCAVQGRNGAIALVGRGQTLDEKSGAPLFFELQDSNGNQIYQSKISLGRGLIDRIISTFDGGYLMVGHARGGQINPENQLEITPKGEQDAWACKLDWSGKLLWHRFWGSNGEETFHDVVQQDDGAFFAVGDSSGHRFAKQFYGVKDLAQQPYGFKVNPGVLQTVCIGEQKVIVYAGQELVYGQKKACIYSLSQEGIEKKLITSGLDKSDVIIRICYDESTQSYGFVSKNQFFYAPKKGTKYEPNQKTLSPAFGGPVIKDLIALQNNEFVLAGSCEGGGRPDGMLVRINVSKQLNNNQKPIDGPKKQGDQFSAICHLENGQVWALGQSEENAWKYTALHIPPATSTQITPQRAVTARRFLDNGNYNDTLNADEYSYLHFQLENRDTVNWQNLRLKTQGLGAFVGLSAWQDLQLGHLAKGTNRFFSLPLPGAFNLNKNSGPILLSITTASGQVIDTIQYVLKTEARFSPNLVIHRDSTFFIPPNNNGNLPKRQQTITLRLAIYNKGRIKADSIQIRFFHPYKVRSFDSNIGKISEKDIDFDLEKVYLKNRAGNPDTIGVDEMKYLYYSFQAMSYFEYDSIPICAVVFSKRYGIHRDTTIGVKILDFYAVPKNGTYQVPVWAKDRLKQRGPNAPEESFVPEDSLWESPKEFIERYGLPSIPCKVLVKELIKPDSTNVQIIVNKQVYSFASRPINPIISGFRIEPSDRGYYLFFDLFLEMGMNEFTIRVGKKEYPKRRIRRETYSKGLYFLGIGIDYSKADSKCIFDKVKCIKNDVGGFFEMLLKQKGIYYDEIKYAGIATSAASTCRDSIEYLMRQFEIRVVQEREYFTNAHIKDKGQQLGGEIRIFLSSHGEISNNVFNLHYGDAICPSNPKKASFLSSFLKQDALGNAVVFVNTCLEPETKNDKPLITNQITGNKVVIFSNQPGLRSHEPDNPEADCHSYFYTAIIKTYDYFLSNSGDGTVNLDQFLWKLEQELSIVSKDKKQIPYVLRDPKAPLPPDYFIIITR